MLLHTEDEIYFGLNRIGLRIWELLGECAGLDELCSRLGSEHPDAPPDVVRTDVRELLAHLARERLVVPAGGAEPGAE